MNNYALHKLLSKLQSSLFLSAYRIYKHDKNNNVILNKHTIASSNFINIETKKFDKMNRLQDEKLISNQNESKVLQYEKKYFYDKENELVKLIITENNIRTVVNFEIIYDKFNNWIEKTSS